MFLRLKISFNNRIKSQNLIQKKEIYIIDINVLKIQNHPNCTLDGWESFKHSWKRESDWAGRCKTPCSSPPRFFRDARDTVISSLAALDAHEPCHRVSGHVSGN